MALIKVDILITTFVNKIVIAPSNFICIITYVIVCTYKKASLFLGN